MELGRGPEVQYFKASMPTVLHMLRNKERVYNYWESATYDDILLQIEVIENKLALNQNYKYKLTSTTLQSFCA